MCAGQEATVRTRPGTTDWFKVGKEVHPVSLSLFPIFPHLFAMK